MARQIGATMRGYRIRATSMNLIGSKNDRPLSDSPEPRPKPETVSLGESSSNGTAFPPMMAEGDDLPF